MESVLLIIFLVLCFSFLLRNIFGILKIPKVLAPIILGIFAQFFLKSYFQSSIEIIDFLANFGAIMVLFYIGLEINTKKLKTEYKETMSIAFYGFLFTFVPAICISYFLLHLSLLSSFVIASVLSITAEGVAVMLLEENRLLKSKLGDIVVGAGIVDDFIGIFLLLILSIILSFKTFSYSFILPTILGITAIIILFYFLKKSSILINSIFVKKKFLTDSIDLLTISIIFLLSFAIFTQSIHLDFSLGAILGGLILNFSLKKNKKIGVEEEKEITNIISNITFGFLIYFFLFWIGFQFTINNIQESIILGLSFALIAFFGKFLGAIFATKYYSESLKKKFLIGIGLSSKGGVELIIASIGRKAGLLSPQLFSAVILMSIILTILSPFLFNYFLNKNENLKHL